MSASGHEQTLGHRLSMSALCHLADILGFGIEVRFVPLTDIRERITEI